MQNEDIPEETVIYIPTILAISEALGALFFVFVAHMLYFYDRSHTLISLSMEASGLVFIYSEIRKFLNRVAQIIINSQGVSTTKTAFKTWAEISNEKVYTWVRGVIIT